MDKAVHRRNEVRAISAGAITAIVALSVFGLLSTPTFEIVNLDFEGLERLSRFELRAFLPLGIFLVAGAAGYIGWMKLIAGEPVRLEFKWGWSRPWREWNWEGVPAYLVAWVLASTTIDGWHSAGGRTRHSRRCRPGPSSRPRGSDRCSGRSARHKRSGWFVVRQRE